MGSDEKQFVRDGDAWEELAPTLDAAIVSRERSAYVVTWSIHTAVDQIWIIAYQNGANVRELRYAAGEGWTKRGTALPFENTTELGRWLRKKRLLASPDGYEVLNAFLGKKPPQPVAEPGANFSTRCSPAQAAELRTIADRAGVSISAVIEAAWHLAKREIYDEEMRRVTKLGLDLTMLVDDTSPPADGDAPAFTHEPVEVSALDLDRFQSSAIPHELAFSPSMLAELDRIGTMFDVPKYHLLDVAYRLARARLV